MSREATIEKQIDSIPLGDRVLVKVEKKEEIRSGLVIAAVANKLAQEGVIISIGDGWNGNGKYRKAEFKLGDRVFFAKYAGTEVKLDGQDYIVMGFNDVLGLIE